jgi:hypothetical protein
MGPPPAGVAACGAVVGLDVKAELAWLQRDSRRAASELRADTAGDIASRVPARPDRPGSTGDARAQEKGSGPLLDRSRNVRFWWRWVPVRDHQAPQCPESPTRTPPPPKPDCDYAMDHLLFGAIYAGGPNLPRPRSCPCRTSPRTSECVGTPKRIVHLPAGAVNGKYRPPAAGPESNRSLPSACYGARNLAPDSHHRFALPREETSAP